MSGPFDGPFDSPFGGTGSAEAMGRKVIADMRARKKTEQRIETMKRRAQNNIDRAHNRAVSAVLQALDDAGVVLTLPQRKALRDVYRAEVRHRDEFGKD